MLITEDKKIELFGRLVTAGELKKELNKRNKEFEYESIPKKHIDDYLDDGWELEREFKTKFKVKKEKPHDIKFEDKVWSVMAKLGFQFLNRDRNFHLPYDKNGNSQQIDVFAKDNESIIIIECKAAKTNTQGNFKEPLEAMKEKINGLRTYAQSLFPESKLKFKFIFATENYAVGNKDLERIRDIGGIGHNVGVHFDEEAIQYYDEMFKQIGLAARYQLLGSLFAGQDIPELDNEIPAIRGKMGKHTYYSFSIEPEKLLKIGYVLHRNKANRHMMPTYQRIIKKSRLKAIHEFIDGDSKGYFPNSIIISIDTNNKKLDFVKANTQASSSIASIGILKIPKRYRSAYIIDGQHRLYGYANSIYKSSNSIPVVAFVDLDRTEQVKLFMEINKNQKAVPKNLRNTLEADLLWTSKSYTEQMEALRSRISIELGENRNSPLFDRIMTGENKKTTTRCIKIDYVKRALKRSNFLGHVTKNKIEKLGTFYKGDLDLAYDRLVDYLIKCLNYLSSYIEEEWEKGEEGIATINKGLYAQIMILSDIVDHIYSKGICEPNDSVSSLFEESKPFIDPIIHFYNDLTQEQSDDLRKRYGSSGDTKYWRTLQSAIKDTYNEFEPEGLDDYLKKEEKEFNEKSFAIIRDLEQYFKVDARERLESRFDKNWWKKGVPKDVYDRAGSLANEKNREIENVEDEVEPWDCLNLIDYRKIALKNWQDCFDKAYTMPDHTKGNKEDKTKWMVKLGEIRNKNFHSYIVSEEEYDFLVSLKEWLLQ
ncbi:DNA sulfur modification protein DndB [Ekhidna lutea]|uniref:DNA sulfur modification protein DndB n=1 Tax=Ekhidna lutea TaxID=447679 RepID=A0A239GZ70_EKHLU|nr:DGQHR domain-containing protein [Ekhidna lutea]SNS73324.1 DNA sulfur modification protein DndB [Ekhidna lutea]